MEVDHRLLGCADAYQNEETLPFTDLGMMEDMKRLENSGKLNGRKIDGTPMQHE